MLFVVVVAAAAVLVVVVILHSRELPGHDTGQSACLYIHRLSQQSITLSHMYVCNVI
jgi:hypothetical protein